MGKSTETEPKNNGNGPPGELVETTPAGSKDDYAAFLQEMQNNGLTADANTAFKEIPMLQPPETRHSNASILAGVPNAKDIYGKDDKNKGILLDFLARTRFKPEQRQDFLDWVEWCEDFGVTYDGPLRWLVSVTSEDGMSRQEYIEAITSYRFKNYGNFNRNEHKPEYRKDGLT